MSRPRLKGDSIAFRLPVHMHDVLVVLARQDGLSPRDYVDRLVQKHINESTRSDPKAAAAAHGVDTSSAGAALLADFGLK